MRVERGMLCFFLQLNAVCQFSSVLGEFRAKKERKKFFKKKKIISSFVRYKRTHHSVRRRLLYCFVSVCVLPNVFSLSSFSCVPFASKVGLFSDDATTMSENRDGAHDDGKSKKRRIVRNNQKQNEKTHRHHHPHRQQQQQSMNPTTTTTTNIDFIEQSFLTIEEDPLMMKFKPNREEIERALKRTTSSFVTNKNENKKTIIDDEEDITTNINNQNNTEEDENDVITRAVDILRAQMTIKMEAEEMAKAMEVSLRENEENEKKRKREEEETRRRDPVKAFASASAMGEKALKRMFLGEGGTNSSKAMELCEFEKKAKKWYKSARETIEDVFEQIGASVENAKTEEEVGEILRNSLELLFEQTLRMPMKAGAIPEIFASEEALEGKNVAAGDVVEVGSSSEEDEEEGQEE